jgi:hypothetical protein
MTAIGECVGNLFIAVNAEWFALLVFNDNIGRGIDAAGETADTA